MQCFCTGGIRCEKASSFLINKGFEQIYQLDGGIINYLEKTKNKNKEWTGECFVFDERVSVNENLEKVEYDVLPVDQLLPTKIKNQKNIKGFIAQNVRIIHH